MGIEVSCYDRRLVFGRRKDFRKVHVRSGWSVERVDMEGGVPEDEFDGDYIHAVATVRGVIYSGGRDPLSHEDA